MNTLEKNRLLTYNRSVIARSQEDNNALGYQATSVDSFSNGVVTNTVRVFKDERRALDIETRVVSFGKLVGCSKYSIKDRGLVKLLDLAEVQIQPILKK